MALVQRRFPLVGLIVLACGQAAFGGTYADPSGFSFTYPDGWVPVTQAAVNQGLPPEVKNWMAKNKVDLNRVAMILIRDGRDEFLDNLNVVVEGQQIPVEDRTVKKLTGMLPQQYAAMGVQVEDFQGRVQKVGARDAVVLEYRARMPGEPDTLRQRQFMLPGGGKTYIVTCTSSVNSFEKYKPTFDGVLASFQAPAPVAGGFDWMRVVLMGVVGGVIGGLAWLVKKLSGKARPKQGSDAPDPGKL
jgi:hypothetical protein